MARAATARAISRNRRGNAPVRSAVKVIDLAKGHKWEAFRL